MWSPLRPTRSGISDYVEDLLPFLTREGESHDPTVNVQDGKREGADSTPTQIDIYSMDEPESEDVRVRCAVLPPSAFESIHRHKPYDALIYHIGSTPEHHRYICEQSLRYPGLLVMHDPNIHTYALVHLQGGKGLQDYLGLVREELGVEAADLARRAWGEGTLAEAVVYKYPMDRWLLQNNRGVIYHSYFAVQDEQRRLPDIPAFYVPLYAPTPTRSNESQRQRILDRHHWPSDAVIIGTYGIIAPSKRINTLLRAFGRLSALYPQVILAVVGDTTHFDILGEVKRLSLDPAKICVTGEVGMADFLAYMQAADIGVNLRYPSLGESSAVISRMMGMGKPIITSDIPQFGELPDEFCWKVPLGDREVDVLVAYLSELVRDQNLRQQMGQAALAYARESMSPRLAASGYRQIAEHIFRGTPEPHLEDKIPARYRMRADRAVSVNR
jgi:glycosyltransferase involved in cell wall biosynthesis